MSCYFQALNFYLLLFLLAPVWFLAWPGSATGNLLEWNEGLVIMRMGFVIGDENVLVCSDLRKSKQIWKHSLRLINCLAVPRLLV